MYANLRSKIPYIASLYVSTVALIITFVVSGLANYPEPEKFGFKNNTGDISDMYYTQITPSGWAFSIWGIIYTWQALWTLYGWSHVIRMNFPIAISPFTLIFYSCANLVNVAWTYVWGNDLPQYSFPIVVIVGVALYAAIGFEAFHLYKTTALLESMQKFKIDLYLTRILVLNGLVIYSTWVAVASLLNFAVFLEYFADVSSTNSGTIALSLLTVEVVAYFILENTLLDMFARPVVMVYPMIIWALSAALDAHWGKEEDNRNSVFTLILLIFNVFLFVVRIILLVVFSFKRQIKYPNTLSVHVR